MTAIAKETQLEGETKEPNHTAECTFAAARGLKEGEDPRSMILEDNESQGEEKEVLRSPFLHTRT